MHLLSNHAHFVSRDLSLVMFHCKHVYILCLAPNYFTPVFILVESTLHLRAPTTLPWLRLHSFFSYISCASKCIGLLAVFNLPAVAIASHKFPDKETLQFLAPLPSFSAHLISSPFSSRPFALPCYERRDLSSGTTHRCQLIITASAITTLPPGDSLSRHRVDSHATSPLFSRQLTALFETSAYSSSASSRREPHRLRIIFLLVSLQPSLLPPRGSSTSSFTGASHLLSVSKPTHTRVSSRLLRLRSSLVWDPLFRSSSRILLFAPYVSLQLVVCGNFSHAF